LKGSSKNPKADKRALFDFEKAFIEKYAREGNIAYNNLLAAEAKFYRAGSLPLTTREKIEALLKEQTEKKTYAFMGGDMATSGDLAYVYGKATFEIMKDGQPQTHNGSYMRFYKKEDGQNWKIVLDLLTN
jgi:ketosteroid isomerase-like protein